MEQPGEQTTYLLHTTCKPLVCKNALICNSRFHPLAIDSKAHFIIIVPSSFYEIPETQKNGIVHMTPATNGPRSSVGYFKKRG